MKKYVISKSWDKALDEKLSEIKDNLKEIQNLRKSCKILPKQDEIFNALKLTDFEDTKVLIIGQDPYPNEAHAHGLAFSSNSKRTPASLRNIFKIIEKDFGYHPQSNNLEKWTKQGVLLLNTSLTFQDKKSQKYHLQLWRPIVEEIYKKLKERKKPLVVLRWGQKAQEAAATFKNSKYIKVLDSSHPSPFSAHQGFMECSHMKKTNEFLKQSGVKEIDWRT